MKLTSLAVATYIGFLTACGNGTSDAQRFNPNRKLLADNVLDGVIIPAQIAEYTLRPTRGYVEPHPDALRQYIGIYESLDGKEVLLTAILNPVEASRRDIVSDDNCGSESGAVTPFPDTQIPYGYIICKGAFEFKWINGNWLMSAATYYKTNSADLVQFVNSYSY